MKYIFSVIGGSGSTFLKNKLSICFNVGDKPDTVFHPFLKLREIDVEQEFILRSNGFKLKSYDNIETAIPEYINYLKREKNHTAIFNICADYKIFSKNKVQDVVFLLRHPLHAYCSWSKEIRHGDVAEKLGGINSKKSISLFINRWISQVIEYYTLSKLGLNPILLRYEFLKEDLKENKELSMLFEDFDSSKRNYNILNSYSESFIHDYVNKYYFKIYPNWII